MKWNRASDAPPQPAGDRRIARIAHWQIAKRFFPFREGRFWVARENLVWLKSEALRRGLGEPQWLFPNDVGRSQDKWVAGTAFRRTLKRAGLPAFRLYDLRHTYASLLFAAGAPITYIHQHAARPRESDHHVAVNQAGSAPRVLAQAVEKIGEPSGTRTQDP